MARSLFLVLGLPGAGKTTLARPLARHAGVRVVDSEQVAAVLPTGRHYRLWRPLVHVLHLLRVVGALLGRSACVVLTDPGTSPLRRRALLALARLGGRTVHVRLLDVPPGCAREGQVARRRALSEPRMQRHERRWREVMADPVSALRGAATVVVLPGREAVTPTRPLVAA